MIEKPKINALDKKAERAIMVGVILPGHKRWDVEDNLAELKQLAATAGVETVDEVVQERNRREPSTFIGKGKVEELTELLEMHDASTVIFDDDLSPAQTRNLEKATDAKIIDRSSLILDIFARNARTRESKTQVELAQLKYMLPRLTRQWTHLSRQVGGIGTKGPGETQLETDRRLVRTRIEVLRKDLARIQQRRKTRRKGRDDSLTASLVGYTNVGKSTIMNLLSDAGVLVQDQLFATLDSTVRQVKLDAQHEILLSDTVGFIRKLPHHLVESFKSTLDEVLEADLLIHVVDSSHPGFEEQIETVKEVINQLGASKKPMLMVFNKIDRLEDKAIIGALKQRYTGSVFISATRQIRVEDLRESLIEFLRQSFVDGKVSFPQYLSKLSNLVYNLAVVTGTEYTDTTIHLDFKATPGNCERILQTVEAEIAAGEKSSTMEQA
ncbi:MAG: GTPase HflX [Calditrichia bacterium]